MAAAEKFFESVAGHLRRAPNMLKSGLRRDDPQGGEDGKGEDIEMNKRHQYSRAGEKSLCDNEAKDCGKRGRMQRWRYRSPA